MTTDDDAPRTDEIIVAEYVLGLLEEDEREALTERLNQEPHLRALETFWTERLSLLADEVPEVEAPHLYDRISDRLFADARSIGWWARLTSALGVWQATAMSAVAALVIVGFVTVLFVNMQDRTMGDWVATLAAEDSDVAFVASIDLDDQILSISGQSGAVLTDQDYELWIIEPDSAPVSLGVVPVNAQTNLRLDDANLAGVREGSILAITIEPLGGAPEGIPTGPVVAAGPLTIQAS